VEIAAHERDARYLERAEAHRGDPSDGRVKGGTRVAPPPARVEDTADRQMGMPWPSVGVGAECPLTEGCFYTRLERAERKRTFGHTHPQDARALHSRERPDSV